MIVKSEEELKWQARNDAITLAKSEEIKKDEQRFNRAVRAAKEMAEERAEELKGLAKVSKTRLPKIDGKESTPKVAGRFSNPATVRKGF